MAEMRITNYTKFLLSRETCKYIKLSYFPKVKKKTTKELESLSIFHSFFSAIFVNLFLIEFHNRIYDIFYSKIKKKKNSVRMCGIESYAFNIYVHFCNLVDNDIKRRLLFAFSMK